MKANLYLQNLKCNGCAKTIINKLNTLKGISSVVVNVEESSVSFEYLQESNLESAKTILMQNGYPEVGIENSITTKAKSFVSCAVGKMS